MKISGWDKWQTYRKDRGTPPWIKVHRNLFSNQEWAALSDSEKGQLISIWILAADKNGIVPDDPRVLQKMCMLNEPPNISKFIDLGFLLPTCQPNDNHVTTTRQPSDEPETETETETEEAKPPLSAGFEDFWKAYPKKVGKKSCLEIWKRKRLHTKSAELVADILTRKEKCRKWDGGFIPNPQTYLNGERWEDEIETKQGSSENQSGICGDSCFNFQTCKATGKLKVGKKCGGFSSENTHKR